MAGRASLGRGRVPTGGAYRIKVDRAGRQDQHARPVSVWVILLVPVSLSLARVPCRRLNRQNLRAAVWAAPSASTALSYGQSRKRAAMKSGPRGAVALGAGCLLARRRKTRMTTMLAAAAA